MPTLSEQAAALKKPALQSTLNSPQANLAQVNNPPLDVPSLTPPTTPAKTATNVGEAQAGIKAFDAALEGHKKKTSDLRLQYLAWGGRVGCNPHFYLHETLRPVEVALFQYETEPFSSVLAKWEFIQLLQANLDALEYNEKYIIKDKASYQAELARQAEVARTKAAGPQPPRVVSGGV